MKLIERKSHYARNEHKVKVTDEEREFSNPKLIHMADNGYKVQDWWPMVESGDAHPGHFGGTVQWDAFDDHICTISVYID